MTDIFLKVLDMSLTGAIVCGIVILVRLFLRRAPKIWSYILWSVVLFRFLCPVSLSVPAAPLELAAPQVTHYGEHTTTVSYIPAQLAERSFTEGLLLEAASREYAKAVSVADICAVLWLCGISVLVLSGVVSYLRMHRDLVGAMHLEENIYLADHIGMPFVLGLMWPRIYIPSFIPVRERTFILAHEKHHIRRGDHILKALAWVALCIHWFDPLAWVAFILAGKDMEMSCDEAVLWQLGPGIRADYSQSLLRLASGQRIISFAPLAFGEGDTKGRVLNMANWKKPRLWISLVCVVVIVAVLAACAVNPGTGDGPQLHKVQGAVEFGHLSLAVPPQYTHGDSEQGGVCFYEGDVLVGGIERYALPEGISAEETDPHALGTAIGVPDSLAGDLAYFGSSSAWADMEIEYFDELAPEELNRSHYFYITAPYVYDFWFDNNQMSQDSQILLLMATELASDDADDELPEQHYDETEPSEERTREELEREEQRLRELLEVTGLEKCRKVLEMVQESGSWWILDEQTNKAVNGILNGSSVNNYLRSGGDWMTTFQIPDGGEMGIFAYMEVDGNIYDNEADSGVREGSGIVWSEGEETEHPVPWLAAYQWNESEISVISWSSDDMGEGVTLRIDALYPGIPETDPDYCPYPSYTVTFWFDWEGAFRYVETKRSITELKEGEYHFLNKESIVSLDEQTVGAEIAREYSNAVQ